jgi:hypothetical protein
MDFFDRKDFGIFLIEKFWNRLIKNLGTCAVGKFLESFLSKFRIPTFRLKNFLHTVDSRYKTPLGVGQVVLYREVSYIGTNLKDLLIIGAKNPVS